MWDIKEINEAVKKESVFVEQILNEVGKVIVGQRQILEGLVLGLLANGHILRGCARPCQDPYNQLIGKNHRGAFQQDTIHA